MNQTTLIRLYIYKKQANNFLRLVRQIMRDYQDEDAIIQMNKLMRQHEQISILLNKMTEKRRYRNDKKNSSDFRRHLEVS